MIMEEEELETEEIEDEEEEFDDTEEDEEEDEDVEVPADEPDPAVEAATKDIQNTQSQAEKLQKVMDFLNARIAENPEAIDEDQLESAINEPDVDDEDEDMGGDVSEYDDDDAEMDEITKDLGSVNEDVDLDDLDDMF